MSAHEGTVLKAFGRAVIPLPDDIAYALGEHVTISRSGDTLTIKPKFTPDEALATNQALADDLLAIWADMPDRDTGKREPVDAPDRYGLI